MAAAFGGFEEPYAWLIRGLVEYGWRDLSQAGAHAPVTAQGFDLFPLTGSQGRSGIVLRVPAQAEGRVHVEDLAYAFEVRFTREAPSPTGQDKGTLTIVARCPDCNYVQVFPWDPANPLHTAGYLHQALGQFVPDFVRWRMQGGEVGMTERKGLPEFKGEACTPELARFVSARLQRVGQTFDQGPVEGWWLGGPPQAGPRAQVVGPIAVVGRAGLQEGGSPDPRGQAVHAVELPGRAMLVAVVAHVGLGLFAGCGNVGSTLWYYGLTGIIAHLPALAFSFVIGMATLLGGAGAWQGVRHFREVEGNPLVYVAFGYLALVPGCCVYGLPIAGWAAYTWFKPDVRRVWDPTMPR